MCLRISEGSQKKIAQEDIVCVKVLSRRFDTYWSPYIGSSYVLGRMKTATMGIPFECKIENGLHSFAPDEIDFAYVINQDINSHLSVACSAVIPKGAEYYEGWFGPMKGYVSNQLIVREELCA